jgi:acetyl esterase
LPLDPYLASVIHDLVPLADPLDFAAFRSVDLLQSDAMFARIGEPGPAVASRRRVAIPVSDGVIEAILYHPDTPGPHPAHLFIHGGGWTLGSVDHAIVDATCRERCVGANCVVLSVGYRKAPEHAFPVPLDDCRAALGWLLAHAERFAVRADVLTVGGQSAGGNLAAALMLALRDAGGPTIALQLLEIPALDLTLTRPSMTTFATGYGLTARDMMQFRDAYVAALEQWTHPYASPLHAADLSRLPPAHVMTAEYDVLRDEAEEYARALAAAGVPTTLTRHAGHVHGSGSYTAVMASARAWRAEILATLRAVHALHGSA